MSVPKWDPAEVGTAYIYVAMADHVAARIEAGELTSGTQLPNERAFAQEYGVSLGTVRRATRLLRERKLVVTVRIKGTFVL